VFVYKYIDILNYCFTWRYNNVL